MKEEDKWQNKTNKEKLDFIFVCIAIVTFSLTAYMHYKSLTRNK